MPDALTEPSFVAETLRWCNDRRFEDGQPPLERLPLGTKGHAKSCPCGAATAWSVYGDGLAERYQGKLLTLELPDAVKTFVYAFDHGELPQYELPPARRSGALRASPGQETAG